ncbi:MAG: SurA N-terminal domain-containing protein [Alphaproteobacteria bacterium]
MLAAIRRFARSWVMKVFLGLLILSFAIWGVGDIFTGGAGDTVAEVGELEITAEELDDSFRRALNQLQQQSNEPLSRQDAIEMGLLEQSLQSLAAQRLLDAEADALGLTSPDEAVRRLIAEEPAFRVDGRFDRERFRLLLRQNNLDEESFAEQLRAERTRDTLTGAVRPPVALPDAVTEPLVDRLAEVRSGRLLVVPDDRFDDVEAPDDATLESYLEEHRERFRAPERRDVTAVLLSPELLMDEISVDESALRERYEADRADYTTAERRVVRQLRGDEEAALQEAFDRLRAGEEPEAVADALESVSLSPLGAVEEAGLPESFANPIFSAPEAGAVTPPVESDFGWHVFIVDEIQPGEQQPFAEVRDELRRDEARRLAAEQLPDLATALDDAIGGGATLEEAADELALPLVRAEGIDREGRTPDGETFEGFTGWDDLVTEAFEEPEGRPSLLEETDDGRFYIYRVDAVEAERTLELAEARERVLDAWRGEEARRRAREAAQRALDDLEAGRSVEDVVADHELETRTLEPRSRTEREGARAVHDALFAGEPGEVAAEVVDADGGAGVVVIDPETDRAEEIAEAVRGELSSGFRRDVLTQFEYALRAAHPVRIDRRALERNFPSEPSS